MPCDCEPNLTFLDIQFPQGTGEYQGVPWDKGSYIFFYCAVILSPDKKVWALVPILIPNRSLGTWLAVLATGCKCSMLNIDRNSLFVHRCFQKYLLLTSFEHFSNNKMLQAFDFSGESDATVLCMMICRPLLSAVHTQTTLITCKMANLRKW